MGSIRFIVQSISYKVRFILIIFVRSGTMLRAADWHSLVSIRIEDRPLRSERYFHTCTSCFCSCTIDRFDQSGVRVLGVFREFWQALRVPQREEHSDFDARYED